MRRRIIGLLLAALLLLGVLAGPPGVANADDPGDNNNFGVGYCGQAC